MRILLFIFCFLPISLIGQDTSSNIISRSNDLPFDPALAPFYHGVASGDPLPTQVIIWTRVTPEDLSQEVEVDYYVSLDPEMTDIIQEGTAVASPERDLTVKVDVEGLEADKTYYYRFEALGASSIVGRTKTAPDGPEDHVRAAVVSCSNYQAGYFNSYARIAERADLDMVFHLGDYLYEYAGGIGTYGFDSTRIDRTNIPNHEILEVADYRTRNSLYKLDPDLRAAHQQHPFLTIWDDHEFANDAFKGGAENHNEGEGDWEQRKANAKQVYFEWMPIRENENNQIYRQFSYGDLMDVILLDTRVEGRDEQIGSVIAPELSSEERTILGQEQKDWFLNELQDSDAQWKIIGNQVIFSEFHVGWASEILGVPYNFIESLFLDIWDGYPHERNEIIDFIGDNSIDNAVILTGDFHTAFAFDVAKFPSELSLLDPLNVDQEVMYDPDSKEGSVAIEFSVPSITSANFDENISAEVAAALQEGATNPISANAAEFPGVNPNPHLKWTNLTQHGYYLLDITEEKVQADYWFVDIFVADNELEELGAAYFSLNGDNHLTEADGPSEEKEDAPELAPEVPFGTTSTKDVDTNDLSLFNVYPNPVIDGKVYVEFAIVNDQNLKMDLYDLNGRLISNLRKDNYKTGHYAMDLDIAPSIASGTYVLTISNGKNIRSTKLTVVK